MLTATQHIEKKKVLVTALTILLTRRFNGADNSGPTINTIYEFYSCYKVEGFLQMKKQEKKRKERIYMRTCVCVFKRCEVGHHDSRTPLSPFIKRGTVPFPV